MNRPGMDGAPMAMRAPQPPVGMAIKMLLSPKEGAAILGPSGAHSKLIAETTGSRLHLSSKGEYYPGTQMQELAIKGPSPDSVANAVIQVLSKLQEETGRISGGEAEVEDGGARVHFVIPVASVRALIGKSGENIKALRMSSGMKIHVEEIVIGNAELGEQVVSCAGAIGGLQSVVPTVVEKVNESAASQPWFQRWVSDKKASPNGGGASYGSSYSKSKGKDAYSGYGGGMGGGYGAAGGYGGGMAGGGYSPYGAAGYAGKGYAGKSFSGKAGGGYGKSYAPPSAVATYAGAGKGQSFSGSRGFSTSAHVATPSPGSGASVDMLSAAVSAVPNKLADPGDRSQVIQCTCPAHLVTGVVGKNGTGLQEIGAATGTDVDVRDMEGSVSEKAIIISGGAIGCVSAYLHVISRMATLQEMMGAGTISAEEMPQGMLGAEPYDPTQVGTENLL